jgi:hypothetical protein
VVALASLVPAIWAMSLPSSHVARAQDPGPSPAAVVTAGDPRSEGEGPGLVGSPVEIALGVVVVGLVTIAGTTVVVRLTRRE